MRLKDADALKEYILRSVPNWSEDREIVLDCIANSPTIEERKKGKWIEPKPKGWLSYNVKAYAECSECGNVQFLGSRMNYCPSCGADMRGEE